MVVHTRRSFASGAPARASVLDDPDLMHEILLQASGIMNGWGRELFVTGTVCKRWRDVLPSVRPACEAWTQFDWHIKNATKLLVNNRTAQEAPLPLLADMHVQWEEVLTSKTFFSSGGAHAWQLMLFDKREDSEGKQIGLFLSRAADPRQSGGAGRRKRAVPGRDTQFELAFLNRGGKHIHRMRCWSNERSFVEFNEATSEWGFNQFWSAGRERLAEMLQAGGDDTLTISVLLRVRGGRRWCKAGRSAPARGHRLLLADPRRVYGHTLDAQHAPPGAPLWHCDRCLKDGAPGAKMFRCSAGCDFDFCEACTDRWHAEGCPHTAEAEAEAPAPAVA